MKKSDQFAAAVTAFVCMSSHSLAGDFAWTTVVNNGQLMPGSTKLFNSYNQPSMNADGLVVFRARSKGPQQPVRGIYTVDVSVPSDPIRAVAVVGGEVPYPNNTTSQSGALATFLEFPSFPRIDIGSGMIATRSQSQPTWTYMLPDGTETRVGTAGVFSTAGGSLATGASLLGAVADASTGALAFPWFSVPGAAPGTRFDQFPGAASACDGESIAFKGNWTDLSTATGKTGVYFRHTTVNGGTSPTQRIADTSRIIPDQPTVKGVLFGSTAPPSAAFGKVVFVGLDVEEAPTMGGIYLAPLASDPPLTTLVKIGDQVPGELGRESFARIGEALSFDGRWVAFWGAWGERMNPRLLTCPDDGNADLLAYCNEQYPDGYIVEVPEHQGFFAVDTHTGHIAVIAKSGVDIDDMLYWNFSGKPPESRSDDKGGEQELPRWRSATFVAIEGAGDDSFQAVFKAHAMDQDALYRRIGPDGPAALPFVGTTTAGSAVDPQAPVGSVLTAVGIERDALRGGRLAMTASMLDPVTSESWAGVYVTDMATAARYQSDLDVDGMVNGADLGLLLIEWGSTSACNADINRSGCVDGVDLGYLLSTWGPCK